MAETLPNTTNMDFNNTTEQVKAYNTLRTYEAIRVLLQSSTSSRRVTLPRTSEIKRTLRYADVTDQENVLDLIVRNIILHPHVNTRQGSSIDSFRVSYKFDTDEKYNIGSRSRSSKSSKRSKFLLKT